MLAFYISEKEDDDEVEKKVIPQPIHRIAGAPVELLVRNVIGILRWLRKTDGNEAVGKALKLLEKEYEEQN